MANRRPELTDAQIARAIQSCGDFQLALSALTFLSAECDYSAKCSMVDLRRFRCYEHTAIVAAARPFKAGRGRAALDTRSFGVELSLAEERVLNKVITLRDKVVAHSDKEKMHFRISNHPPFLDSLIRMPLVVFEESLLLDAADATSVAELLRRLLHGLAGTIFDIAQCQPERVDFYMHPANPPD